MAFKDQFEEKSLHWVQLPKCYFMFRDLPTPRRVSLPGWRLPSGRMPQVVLDYTLPVARMILTWLLT